MKTVSFMVAKAIKEAWYPQEKGDVFIVKASNGWNEGEKLSYLDAWHDSVPDECLAYAPTYLEVWLWLWREKGTPIKVDYTFCGIDCQLNDPEEAIISAIEYLVENNLIF